MDQQNFSKNKGIAAAFLAMAMALRPAKYPDGVTPKGRYSSNREPTKKGAVHIQGKPFKARRVGQFVGSAYRSQHIGRVSPRWINLLKPARFMPVVPNHKKPHDKPRGRNLVQPKGFLSLLGRGGG